MNNIARKLHPSQFSHSSLKGNCVRICVPAIMLFFIAACAGPATPTIPVYFQNAVFEASMAQTLTESCEAVSYREEEAAAVKSELSGRILAEGVSPSDLLDWVNSPEYDDWIATRSEELLVTYDVDPDLPGAEESCKIAKAEMAKNSGIGRILEES